VFAGRGQLLLAAFYGLPEANAASSSFSAFLTAAAADEKSITCFDSWYASCFVLVLIFSGQFAEVGSLNLLIKTPVCLLALSLVT
jgi:hypothetical protein